MSLMKTEVAHGPAAAAKDEPILNYIELYRTFVKHRKIKLIRYLFAQKMDFEFKVEIFIMTLDESAFDVAVLLYKEFAYLMRNNSDEDNRQIVSRLVSGMNQANEGSGMIEEKTFLIRVFMTHFQLRHARQLLDHIEKKGLKANKLNLFVNNFNVVKTGCVLIEVLELIGT